MAVRCFALGPFQTNCYVIGESEDARGASVRLGSACWIIDASFEPDALIKYVKDRELQPRRLILTHAHIDHIAGIDEIVEALGPLPVALHGAERDWLSDPSLNLSIGLGAEFVSRAKPRPDEMLEDGQTLELDGSLWRVSHTPGHSPGGVTLHCERAGIAMVGDTLFAGSIGRTDFPTSDAETLFKSIREELYVLPGETRIYPGHGPTSTIARERASNPFVRG
jgi:glyoxylase-like metal-dependent hydrolase (beta-lactamase superfamily II)